jgi:chromosome segregation protein
LREQRRALTDLQQQRGAIEVELAQKNMAVQNLRDRIREKYQLNLDDIRSECITITLADEGPAKVHTLTPEEMAASGAGDRLGGGGRAGDRAAGAHRRNGPGQPGGHRGIRGNRAAPSIPDHAKRRPGAGQAQLLEVINRINTQTRQMFVETFEKIRDNFRQMFVEIFGGGKADLS